MPAPKLPVKRKRNFKNEMSLSEKAYLSIKRMIFGARFLPREPITELRLTALFEMSRTPVREALKQLRNEGILISFGKKGYSLNVPSITETKDLYEVRILLESGAARLAAAKIDVSRLEDFRKQFLSHKNSLNSGQEEYRNGEAYPSGDLGRAFHFFIIESTGNTKLRELMEKIYDQLAVSRIFAYNPRRKEATDEHLKLVDALMQRDAQKSHTYMEEHLRSGFEILTGIL